MATYDGNVYAGWGGVYTDSIWDTNTATASCGSVVNKRLHKQIRIRRASEADLRTCDDDEMAGFLLCHPTIRDHVQLFSCRLRFVSYH